MASSQLAVGLCIATALVVASLPGLAFTDTDGDGLSDGFELTHGFDPLDPDEDSNGTLDGQDDSDADGLLNAAEEVATTDPHDDDTDDDGLLDGEELAVVIASEHVIATYAGRTVTVVAVDLDGDGDTDVVSGLLGSPFYGDRVVWFENDGATSPSWVPRTVSPAGTRASALVAADLDGDGDTDVLAALNDINDIVWYKNNGTTPPSFSKSNISVNAGSPRSLFATDIDGDSDIDILVAASLDDSIVYYDNDGANPPSWTKTAISTVAFNTRSVFAADIDGDRDMDAISTSDTELPWPNSFKISWYENDGATPPAWTDHTVATIGSLPKHVIAEDFDGDGDKDLITASNGVNSKLSWWKNDGATPPSWTEYPVSTTTGYTSSLAATDIDGDGDTDILSTSVFDDTVIRYDNSGGIPPSWAEHLVSTTADGAAKVSTADVDGDGDTDVLAALSYGEKLSWYEQADLPLADPLDPDTDDDGLLDGFEVENGFDPRATGEENEDPDQDGLTNLAEQTWGTDPNLWDTDGDTASDGAEVAAGTDPLDPNHYPPSVPSLATWGVVALVGALAGLGLLRMRRQTA